MAFRYFPAAPRPSHVETDPGDEVAKVEALSMDEPHDAARACHELALAAFSVRDFAAATAHADRARRALRPQLVFDHRRPAPEPDYSVILATFRGLDVVSTAIGHIRTCAAAAARPHELIIVDNGGAGLDGLAASPLADACHIRTGFNYGASGGRNVGAAAARAKYLLFLDDDGIPDPAAFIALLAAIERSDAAAVRGRILKKSASAVQGGSNDLGPVERCSLPDGEGISIWRRDLFLAHGGFDPLLAGHEGVKLCCDMYRFVGPAAFRYAPEAILLHDFAADAEAAGRKIARYEGNLDYLRFLELPWQEIVEAIRRVNRDDWASYAFAAGNDIRRDRLPAAPAGAGPVSILTTAHNAAGFVQDFTRGLRAQTCPAFELIFVDDGSSDATSEVMAGLWSGDARLRCFREPFRGRAGAINVALANARHDICLIADADDISVPDRIELSVRYLAANPAHACVSFCSFDEKRSYDIGPPRTPLSSDIGLRRLFGMPVSFPTFAFRRSAFLQPMDESLTAGSDCDWLHRNLAGCEDVGRIVPMNVTYYRKHAGQISSVRRDRQREVATRYVRTAHLALMGALSEADAEAAERLSGWRDTETHEQLWATHDYILKVLARTAATRFGGELSALMLSRYAEPKLSFLEIENKRLFNWGYQLETLKRDWFDPELKRLHDALEQYEAVKRDWYEPQLARLEGALDAAETRGRAVAERLAELEALKRDWFDPELARLHAVLARYEATKNKWFEPQLERLSAELAKALEANRILSARVGEREV